MSTALKQAKKSLPTSIAPIFNGNNEKDFSIIDYRQRCGIEWKMKKRYSIKHNGLMSFSPPMPTYLARIQY